MNEPTLLVFLADLILIIHTAFVGFIVFGLLAIYVGAWRSWTWVRNIYFRIAHLVGIGIVASQSWFSVICPLTIWEMQLRAKAGSTVYQGSFIQHWLQSLLYYDFPNWVFVLAYSLFAALVLLSWFIVKPNTRAVSV